MHTCEICGAAIEYTDARVTHRAWHQRLRTALNALEGRVDQLDDNSERAWLAENL